VTKTEQTLLSRVREENDAGKTCWNPVSRTKGEYRSWRRGGRSHGPENKKEAAAWARMVSSGDVIKCPGSGYAVPGHSILIEAAAGLSLFRIASHVEEKRQALEAAEKHYSEAAEFIRKYGSGT
jgi:hypothetical protein